MTNEERDIISRFIERVSGAASTSGVGDPGQAPQLPPIDREADGLIGELFNRYPEARYRLTQTAFVQEQALVEAQNRIKRMEWELEQAKQAQQQAEPVRSPWNSGAGAGGFAGSVPATQPAPSRGFFGNLFGGGSQPPQAPPQYQQPQYQQPQYQQPPQYQPPYQPGAFQRSGGSGFLGSALTTAAGVAGGLVVGNALMDLFSPHQASASPGLAAGLGTPVPGAEGPWSGGAAGGANPWDNATNTPDPAAGWDNAAPDPGTGWDNAANTPDSDSNWDNASDTSGGDWGSDTGGDSGGFDDT